MDRALVNSDIDEPSLRALQGLYAGQRVPPEKKPFLISLRDSSGPAMVVDGGGAILDVASQIASMAAGFNPGVAFGVAEILDSWTGRTDSTATQAIRAAFIELLARQLGWHHLHLHLCHSGAEANETALGMCYQRRKNRAARHVIAFRNSFHGRMLVTLAATWNPAKREPFAWPGCQASFVDYPEMPVGDDVRAAPVPAGWQSLWSTAPRRGFDDQVRARFAEPDGLLSDEIDSLLQARALLQSGQHFAVILEPMQCEGGDRYSSARFHQALINLCRAFEVPLVYDEIQTGFGLGGDFFWHRKFDLRDDRGQPVHPDYVVIAKKAQVGAVIAHHASPFGHESFDAASLARGFIQASIVEQYRKEINAIEQRSRTELPALLDRYPGQVDRPRISGLSFAFDFADPEMLKRFVAQRFHHGLLYYPAGDRAARFRFNLAMRDRWLDVAWQQIRAALQATFRADAVPAETVPVAIDRESADTYYDFHQQFLARKLAAIAPVTASVTDARQFIRDSLQQAGLAHLELIELDAESWPDWRERIERLQTANYEPLRQTPIKKFDRLIRARNSLAIVVCEDQEIVAMAFAAPPSNFPLERGLRGDERFDDPQTVYMLDLTVIRRYRGQLGRLMKQWLCLLAQQRGLSAVIGRNRDHLARGMWAINLSLGSYITRVIREDYMDEHDYRDCLMYRCDLTWDLPPQDLSGGVDRPLTGPDLNPRFCRDNMPTLVNKLTLSNFVTRDFLENLEYVFALLPDSLQHGYTASGVSECVDKLVKAIWLQRKPRTRLVTLAGSWYGTGSFLARALTGTGESWFDVQRIAGSKPAQVMRDLDQALAADAVLAVFVEPLGWMNGRRIPLDGLLEIQEICRRHHVPLVSHDSGGLFYRYTADRFGPSGTGGYLPDAGLIALGGQMAMCYMDKSWFVDTPLMFISTWDGDAFSLARFAEMARRTHADPSAHEELIERFHQRLIQKLADNGVTDYDLFRGTGWFNGPVEARLAHVLVERGRAPGLFAEPRCDAAVCGNGIGTGVIRLGGRGDPRDWFVMYQHPVSKTPGSGLVCYP